jgi:hypothetical protein
MGWRVNEEMLSLLSLEDKLKVTQFLVADFAASLLSDDQAVVTKARHDLGAIAMTFSNLYQLVNAARPDSAAVITSIHSKFRYQESADDQHG